MGTIVEAPARLHFGFLDLNGGLGRRFGSLGLTIDSLATRLEGKAARKISATGPGSERAAAMATALIDALGLDGGIEIRVQSVIPRHSGLGSGTQMALAVGSVIGRIYGLDVSLRRIAELLQRGARSGIGIGAFEDGGFLVDGGRRPGGELPSVIARQEFPPHWRALLLFDRSNYGLHGNAEREAFRALPPASEEESARLCRILMMKLLPGIAEQRLDEFSEAIGEIQASVGDYFAPAQGGRFASSTVTEALAWLRSQGRSGVGQSSWGPTGFVFVDGEANAHHLLQQLRRRFPSGRLRYQIVAGRNSGGLIEEIDESEEWMPDASPVKASGNSI